MLKKSAHALRLSFLLLAGAFMAGPAPAASPFALAVQHEVSHEYDSAVEQYKIAAGQGVTEAMHALGRLYRDEYHDDEKSLHWFLKAAGRGDVFAQHEIGLLYQSGGGGVQADPGEAARWFVMAAGKSHKAAAYQLFSLAADDEEKRKWLLRSADLGYPKAMRSLADAYLMGEFGLPVNHDLAQRWRDRAAQAEE